MSDVLAELVGELLAQVKELTAKVDRMQGLLGARVSERLVDEPMESGTIVKVVEPDNGGADVSFYKKFGPDDWRWWRSGVGWSTMFHTLWETLRYYAVGGSITVATNEELVAYRVEVIPPEPPVGAMVTARHGWVWKRTAAGWMWWHSGDHYWVLSANTWERLVELNTFTPTTVDECKRVGISPSEWPTSSLWQGYCEDAENHGGQRRGGCLVSQCLECVDVEKGNNHE